MDLSRNIYVLNTDVLLDYKHIIQFEGKCPVQSNVDLNDAHLVIPEIVIRRMSELIKYNGERGVAAESLLKQLNGLLEGSGAFSMRAVYRLDAICHCGNQFISILPVQKELLECLPFHLSEDDVDDQVIATTIAAGLAYTGTNANGYISKEELNEDISNNVILLTNDSGLAVRAHGYGLRTSHYDSVNKSSFTKLL